MECDLRVDIFRLLCLIDHNTKNSLVPVHHQLPIQQLAENPGQDLKVTDMILFENHDVDYSNARLPFYFPARREKRFNASQKIPRTLMTRFFGEEKDPNLRYLSTLSSLYEYYTVRAHMAEGVGTARWVIENAISQELKKSQGYMLSTVTYYDYGSITDYRFDLEAEALKGNNHWLDEIDAFNKTFDDHLTLDEREKLMAIGEGCPYPGYQAYLVPQFILYHLSVISKLIAPIMTMNRGLVQQYPVHLVAERENEG